MFKPGVEEEKRLLTILGIMITQKLLYRHFSCVKRVLCIYLPMVKIQFVIFDDIVVSQCFRCRLPKLCFVSEEAQNT